MFVKSHSSMAYHAVRCFVRDCLADVEAVYAVCSSEAKLLSQNQRVWRTAYQDHCT